MTRTKTTTQFLKNRNKVVTFVSFHSLRNIESKCVFSNIWALTNIFPWFFNSQFYLENDISYLNLPYFEFSIVTFVSFFSFDGSKICFVYSHGSIITYEDDIFIYKVDFGSKIQNVSFQAFENLWQMYHFSRSGFLGVTVSYSDETLTV